jgi:putative flippase GtrA
VTAKDLAAKLVASRFIRFGIVGGGGFVVNEAALFGAHSLCHTGPQLSWVLAFIPSVIFTWWGNRNLTFPDRASAHLYGMATECGRFVVTNSIGALANFLVYAATVRYAPFPFSIPYLALVAGVFVGLIFNFTFSLKVVFRS